MAHYSSTVLFILDHFQNFYEEVLRQKARAIREIHEELSEEEADILPGDLQTEALQTTLKDRLDQYSRDATQTLSESGLQLYREALYIMVALADEVFLTLGWPGHHSWSQNPLEAQLFRTTLAGEEIFRRIEDLPQTHEIQRRELAVVYVLALGLGFEGKYREDEGGEIERHRRQLYQITTRQASQIFGPQGTPHLDEACYAHTLSQPRAKNLPDMRLWMGLWAGVLASYLFISYLIWYQVSEDMERTLSTILAHEKRISPQ